jgi:hypothetical protein
MDHHSRRFAHALTTASRLVRASAIGVGVLTAACSWGRFDELEDDAPVVLLKKPKQVSSGFGSSLAASPEGERALVFVGGAPGRATGALFDLGSEQSPKRDAIGTDYCSSGGDAACFLAAAPAALGAATPPNDALAPQCFAVGVGTAGDRSPTGVIVECEHEDGERVGYSLAAPQAFVEDLERAIDQQDPELVVMAAGTESPRALAVGSAERRSAWFYTTADGGAEPQELVPPGDPEADYGATIAVLDLEAERLLAVGAPEAGRVHLFAAGEAPRYVGCLGGTPGFGRAMASGAVSRGDASPELVIADGREVRVFAGAALLELEADGTDCSLDALSEGALLASLECEVSGDASGCGAGDFGAAMAVGDFDGDGDGEVAVGVPGMTVRSVRRSGAVLVYDVEGNGDPAELRFISSAETDDRLGSALAAPRIEGRHLLVASAPGGGKTALLYCLDMLPDSLAGARCR